MLKLIIFLLTCAVMTATAGASDKPSFAQYVTELKAEALHKGYSAELLEQAFKQVRYRQKVVKADRNQPETKLTLDKYLATRVPDWKVNRAVDRLQENRALLQKVSKHYGVQARFIVALWGNESNFGQIQGHYPVLSSLTTMAYDGRRESMFRKQIFAALDILQQGHISADKLVGSWAGAMGQSQFMPSSFLSYAVDFDGDGKKDIWQNKADVFASIAHYLKSAGWNDSLTWGRQVKLVKEFDPALAGLSASKMRPLSRWQQQGVRRYDGSDLPSNNISASVIMPDGEKGRIYLVYDNFHTLMKWNRSTYFGVSVGYLSDRIKRGY